MSEILNLSTTAEIAKKWQVSERQVRRYCAAGRVPDAIQQGDTWLIPSDTPKPTREPRPKSTSLLEALRREDAHRVTGGIYHKVQIELTYNSNHIEGSQLTHAQTRYIFETNTVAAERKFGGINTDDIVETTNHFRCIDYIIENANRRITASMIKKLHFILKNGTSDSREDWFAVGDYKKLPNEVGGRSTTPPDQVAAEIASLLEWYNSLEQPEFEDLLDFHWRFESIHPFQDGNGRVGRLILFKECLRWNIVPFIIDEPLKMFYYRGLHEWKNQRGYLLDACLTAQDKFKAYLDYFNISYK